MIVATLLTLAIAVFLTAYWLFEPQRVKSDTERMRQEAAQKGKDLYQKHCQRCHGEKGGPQRGIRPINSKEFLTHVDDTVLYKIIERGIPGTGMASLGEKEGGPLNAEQIQELVAYIRSWEKTAPSWPIEKAAPEGRPVFLQEEAAYVGSSTCIDCHEGMNKSHIEVWKKSPMAQKAFSLIENEKDQSKCMSCHATGYDAEKKSYAEKNVGCEACHGPGEKYAEMMSGANAVEGGKIARENARKSCFRCHNIHVGKREHIDLARQGKLT